MKGMMTFIATGDSFITRRIPSQDIESFQEIKSFINKAEARFTNLEVTIHNGEGFPSAFSGGTWAMAPPGVLKDLKAYNFNLIAWANNHTLDYSYGGLAATEKNLNHYGFVHAGGGNNLAEASAPKYLDCPTVRVALIAATSTFHESWLAGEQRPDMIGRPGVNPLRFTTTYTLPKNQLEQLKAINSAVKIPPSINAMGNDENVFFFGSYRFKEGEHSGFTSQPVEKDLKRILRSISEARCQADYVIVSIHSHESGKNMFHPAEFLIKFSRSCIDAGAHAVIGHGPHILRGIEIYKNRPIFYSLGNFIFQNETIPHLPWDFYEQFELDQTMNIAEALEQRKKRDPLRLDTIPYMWESIIAFWSMEKGELKELKLCPIELGFDLPPYRRGWPVPSNNRQILELVQKLSALYGTQVKIEGSLGKVILK